MASRPRAVTTAQALEVLEAAHLDPDDALALQSLAVAVASRNTAAAAKLDALLRPDPFVGLPPECAVGCLAASSFADLCAVASVCKSWCALRKSPAFLAARKAVDERALVLAGWAGRVLPGVAYDMRFLVLQDPGADRWQALLRDVPVDQRDLPEDEPAVDDLVVFQGKLIAHLWDDRCFQYDLVTKSWLELKVRVRSPEFQSWCATDNEIVTLGQGPVSEPLMRSFRPEDDSLVILPSPPLDVCQFMMAGAPALCCLGNVVYLVGGEDPGGGRSDAMQAFDMNSRSWKVCARMPMPRADASAAGIDGRIFVVGNDVHSGIPPTNLVHSYNPLTDRWRVEPPLPMHERDCFAVRVIGHKGKVVAVGATNFSLENGVWRPLPQIPPPDFERYKLHYNLEERAAEIAAGILISSESEIMRMYEAYGASDSSLVSLPLL